MMIRNTIFLLDLYSIEVLFSIAPRGTEQLRTQLHRKRCKVPYFITFRNKPKQIKHEMYLFLYIAG